MRPRGKRRLTYRYSEDLDFSADGRTWDERALSPLFAAACNEAKRLTHPYGPFDFTSTPVIHHRAHDQGQLNYKIPFAEWRISTWVTR